MAEEDDPTAEDDEEVAESPNSRCSEADSDSFGSPYPDAKRTPGASWRSSFRLSRGSSRDSASTYTGPSRILVRLQFGELRMTQLAHFCALGDLDGARRSLSEAKASSTLESELVAKDDWAGSSPLHWAVYAGNVLLVKMLIEEGAHVTQTNDRDESMPIHLGARYGQSKVIEALLEARCSCDVTNNLSNTPLHECASQGQERTAKVLLLAKADLEAMNSSDLTPLLVASANGHFAPSCVCIGPRGRHVSTTRRPVQPSSQRPVELKRATVESLDFASWAP